jgi:hypothetical protein
MNREQKNLLIAFVLGDGHLHKHGVSNSVSLVLKHSTKQEEYIKHKADIVNSICGGYQSSLTYSTSGCNNNYKAVSYSKANKYFRVLRKFIYKNNKKTFPDAIIKRLGKKEFAYLWMDDGSITAKRRNGNIVGWIGFLHVYEDKDTCERLANQIDAVFGVKPLLRFDRTAYRLEFNTTKLRILLPQIEPYVIESLKYKVIMKR